MASSSQVANSRPTNPTVGNRKPTDLFFFLVFLINIFMWMEIGIKAIYSFNHPKKDVEYEPSPPERLFLKLVYIMQEFRRCIINVYAENLFYQSIYILLCIFLIKLLTAPLIFIGIIVHLLHTLYVGQLFVREAIEGSRINDDYSTAIVVWFFLRMMSSVAGIASLREIGMSLTETIIHDSSRIICNSGRVVLWYGLFLIVEYSILTVMYGFMFTNLLSGRELDLILGNMICLLYGGFFVLYGVHKTALTMISRISMDYYYDNGEHRRTENKMCAIEKYHLGTVALSSALPVPWIYAIIQAFKHEGSQEQKENVVFYYISKIFLTLSMPFNALIFSSIYGTDFAQSSRMTFEVVLRRCSLFLATTWVIEALVDLIAVSFFILDFFLDEEIYEDSRHTNPVVEDRQVTDEFFTSPMTFIWIFTIVVAILGFYYEIFPGTRNDDALVSFGPFFDKIIPITKEFRNNFNDKFLVRIVCHSIYVLLCTFLIKLFTTPLIFVGLIVHILRTLYTSYALTNKTMNGCGMDEYLAFAFAVWIIVRITSTIAGLASMCKIDMTVPRNIIRQSSRMICHSSSMIIAFGMALLFMYLVSAISANMAHGHLRSTRKMNFILIMYTSIILTGCFITCWQHKEFLMVASHYIVEYYWKNDEHPPFEQSMSKTNSYHDMTIVIATLTPMPWLCAIDQASEHSRPQGKEDNIIFYLVCKTFLIASMPFDALIFTAIYGTGFAKSSQMAFDVVLRRCKIFLATTWIIEALIDSITVSYFYIDMLLDRDTYEGVGIEDILLSSYSLFDFVGFPYFSFLSLPYICTKALLINQIIIMNNED